MTDTPGLVGLHHLTLPAADLDAGCAWYERVLGARRLDLDHHDDTGRLIAVVLQVPGLGTLLQLRIGLGIDTASGPPFTMQVEGPEHLRAWIAHLDALGIEHSPVERRHVGTSVTLVSPGGTLLRFQTRPDRG